MNSGLFGALVAAGSSLIFPHISCAQISIVFDYSYDAGGFFDANSFAKTDLEAAASALQSRLADQLLAIAPGGGDTWSAIFLNPSTGTQQSVNNLSVPANTIVVYAGARTLGSSTLGLGLFGDASMNGSSSWTDTVRARGQVGAPGSDFGPWGGSIAFNSTASWYFDSDPSTTESFAGQTDFYSVALHELAHVLGFGTAASWNSLVAGSRFNGPASELLNGSLGVPLDASRAHWANGTISTLPGTLTLQEAAMDPSLAAGARKQFTDLDWAGLSDTGWEVTPVPEPQAYMAVTAAGLIGFALTRRKLGRRFPQQT